MKNKKCALIWIMILIINKFGNDLFQKRNHRDLPIGNVICVGPGYQILKSQGNDERELHKEIFRKLSKYCRNEYSCTRYFLGVDSYFVEYLKWRLYITINFITLVLWIPLITKQVKQWYLRSFVETAHAIQISSLCNTVWTEMLVFIFLHIQFQCAILILDHNAKKQL